MGARQSLQCHSGVSAVVVRAARRFVTDEDECHQRDICRDHFTIRRDLSVHSGQESLPQALPRTATIPHSELARRNVRRFQNGIASRGLLLWLLLGSDGCSLLWRHYGSVLDHRIGTSSPDRKGASNGTKAL